MTSSLPAVATEICEHAESIGAGRIVFVAASGFVFCAPDIENVLTVLTEQAPMKYKLQAQAEKRWVDVSKYSMLGSVGDVIENIRNGHVEALIDTPDPDIKAAAVNEPVSFMQALRSLNRTTSELLSKRFTADVAYPPRDLARRVNQAVDSEHTRYLSASFELVADMTSIPIADLLNGSQTEQALATIDRWVIDNRWLYNDPSVAAAVAVNRGKVLSVKNREVAAEQFADSKRANFVIKALYTDMGSLTYFNSDDITDSATILARAIRDKITEVDPGRRRNHNAIGISVDPNYLRIYAPILMHYSQQMPDIDYCIILCGDPGNVIKDINLFRDALAVVNSSGRPENVHLYSVNVPEEVADPRTFYASARFFAIDALLAKYPSVYIMDADLTTMEDPRPFFRAVSGLSFAVPTSRGFDALSPWRRYMAGNLAVNQEALSGNIVSDMQRYLAHGLTLENSWMLDQNALTYTIERNPEYFKSLDDFRRPFRQPRFRSVWEKSFRQ